MYLDILRYEKECNKPFVFVYRAEISFASLHCAVAVADCLIDFDKAKVKGLMQCLIIAALI